MPATSYGTSGYGSSGGRTSSTGSGRGYTAGRGFTPASTPSPNDLSGRKSLASTRAPELANDRTQAEIDAMRRRLDLDAERQSFDTSHIDRQFGLTQETHGADMAARQKRGALTDSIASLFMGEFKGGGGDDSIAVPGAGGGVVQPGAAPGAPPAAVGGNPAADATAAADAGYSRLKEREGMRLRGDINTAKRTLGRRGLAGSSFEAPAIAELIGGSSGRLADFDAASQADAVGRARQVEDRDVVRGDRAREFESGQRDNRLQMLLQLLGVSGSAY